MMEDYSVAHTLPCVCMCVCALLCIVYASSPPVLPFPCVCIVCPCVCHAFSYYTHFLLLPPPPACPITLCHIYYTCPYYYYVYPYAMPCLLLPMVALLLVIRAPVGICCVVVVTRDVVTVSSALFDLHCWCGGLFHRSLLLLQHTPDHFILLPPFYPTRCCLLCHLDSQPSIMAAPYTQVVGFGSVALRFCWYPTYRARAYAYLPYICVRYVYVVPALPAALLFVLTTCGYYRTCAHTQRDDVVLAFITLRLCLPPRWRYCPGIARRRYAYMLYATRIWCVLLYPVLRLYTLPAHYIGDTATAPYVPCVVVVLAFACHSC